MLELLTDYFSVFVSIEPFHKVWRSVAPSHGASAQVMSDYSGGLQLCLGPLSRERFNDFLPDGSDLVSCLQLARVFVGLDMSLCVRLQMDPNEQNGLTRRSRFDYDAWFATRGGTHSEGWFAFIGFSKCAQCERGET